jgi:O-antigen/teichoic acid export membrane protein
VSYLQKQGDARAIVELVGRMVRKLALAFLPLYALLLVVAHEFIVLLFTGQYAASVPIFRVNLTLIPLAILASACDPVVRAYAEHRFWVLRMRLVMLAVMTGAILVGLKTFGMLGAITAAVAVNLVERLVTARKCARVLGATRRDWTLVRDVWKIAAAALAAAALTAAARVALGGVRPFFVLAACGAVFSAAYLAGVLLFGVPTREERAAVRRRAAALFKRRPVAGGRAAQRLT